MSTLIPQVMDTGKFLPRETSISGLRHLRDFFHDTLGLISHVSQPSTRQNDTESTMEARTTTFSSWDIVASCGTSLTHPSPRFRRYRYGLPFCRHATGLLLHHENVGSEGQRLVSGSASMSWEGVCESGFMIATVSFPLQREGAASGVRLSDRHRWGLSCCHTWGSPGWQPEIDCGIGETGEELCENFQI